MNVRVNGEQRDLAPGTTVAALVAASGHGPRGLAVAVNEDVVARSCWMAVELRDGDRVEILVASQGG